MGAFRVGSARMKRWAAIVACGLAGCGQAPSESHVAYAEIVAEEDARGRHGLDRVDVHLASADPALRALAVRAVGRLEDPSQLGRLETMLEDPDPTVRAVVAGAMAQAVFRDDPGAVLTALAGRIDGEADPVALGSLATNLGRLGFRSAGQRAEAETGLAAVARRIVGGDDDPGFVARLDLARGIEAFARGGQGDEALGSELVAAAVSLSAVSATAGQTGHLTAVRVRRLAAAALVHAGRFEADDTDRLLQDPDWGVRREAVVAAARYGTASGEVIPAGLEDPDPRVRVEALRAYDRWLRPGGGCAAIFRAMGDSDAHVSITAIGLAARPCPDQETQRQALADKVAEMDDADADWRGPVRALHALAGIAPGEVGDEISGFAGHANPFVRAWAARAAAQVGDVDALRGLSGDSDANVRVAALQGMGSLVGGGARDIYLAQLDADDPQLVMTATRHLVDFAPEDTPVSALLTALARFTAMQRETARDVRVALLDGTRAVGGHSSDDLAPYVTDFDPVVAARAAALLTQSTGVEHEADPRPLPPTPTPDAARLAALERSTIRLRMAGLGDIVIALRPDLAATNADRFARLAREGYFDGLTFHRVEANFVIQGGSPHANEYAGDGPFSRDEISDQPHWRGTVGLSTRGRDTGDAQIFINLVDNVRLDFNYTIYGEVVEGMEVVDAVQEGAVIERAVLVGR